MAKRRKPIKGRLPKRAPRSAQGEALERSHGYSLVNRLWRRSGRRYVPRSRKGLYSENIYRGDGRRIPNIRRYPFADLSDDMRVAQFERLKRFLEGKVRSYTLVSVRIFWEGQNYGGEITSQWSIPEYVTSMDGPEDSSFRAIAKREMKPKLPLADPDPTYPRILVVDVAWD